MGTIKRGILGGFSGKVGTVVGASWKGIDYIRSIPAKVRNPRTPDQVKQRTKFATVINFLTKITPVIKVGFKNYANKQTAFNAAVSYNLLNAVTGSKDDYKMDYSKVLVSRGSLYKPISGTTKIEDDEVSVAWDVNYSGNGSYSDMSTILLFNPDKNESIIDAEVTDRAEGFASIAYKDQWKGDEIEIFLMFTSEDGKLVSDSLYLGQVLIPEA